jgi:hypothetical protein
MITRYIEGGGSSGVHGDTGEHNGLVAICHLRAYEMNCLVKLCVTK